MMERKKILAGFEKEIGRLKRNPVSDEEIQQYYDLIIQSIQGDLKDGCQDILARNLTLGIGVHAGAHPKHLILNGRTEGWKYITRYLLWQGHILDRLFDYKEVTPRSVGCIIGLALLWGMDDLARQAGAYFQLRFQDDKQKKYRQKESHHLFLARPVRPERRPADR